MKQRSLLHPWMIKNCERTLSAAYDHKVRYYMITYQVRIKINFEFTLYFGVELGIVLGFEERDKGRNG